MSNHSSTVLFENGAEDMSSKEPSSCRSSVVRERKFIDKIRKDEIEITDEIVTEIMKSPEFLAIEDAKIKGEFLTEKIIEIKTRYR